MLCAAPALVVGVAPQQAQAAGGSGYRRVYAEEPRYWPRPLTIRKYGFRARPQRPLRARDLLCPRPDDPRGRCHVGPSRSYVTLPVPGTPGFLRVGGLIQPQQVPPVDYTQPAYPPVYGYRVHSEMRPHAFGRFVPVRGPARPAIMAPALWFSR